jgi:hypothetical protein
MANVFFVNNAVGTGATAMYNLKERLKAAGWTVIGSGDGVSSSNLTGTDLITSASIFAAANYGAWIVLKQPGSLRQLCIAKKNDGTGQPGRNWRIKYSPRLGFTDGPRQNGVIVGSISATNNPSSADERLLLSNPSFNDDTSINSGGQFFIPDNTHIHHIMCQDAAPYGFWMIGYSTSNPTTRVDYVFMSDPVVGYDPLDVDPYVWYVTNIGGNPTNTPLRSSGMFGAPAGNGTSPFALWRAGLTNETWAKCCAPSFLVGGVNARAIPAGIGQNIYQGGDDLLPVPYFGQRLPQSTALGAVSFKGFSTLFRWKGANYANLKLLRAVTDGDLVVFDDVVADWNGSTPRQA